MMLVLVLVLLVAVALMVAAMGWAQHKNALLSQKRFDELATSLRSLDRRVIDTGDGVVNAVAIGSLGFAFPVNLGGPSIDPFHARLLVFLLQLLKPKKILELGSGSSTVLIAQVLQRLKCHVDCHVSVDHEEKFLGMAKELAAINGVDSNVTFRHCPLAPIDGYGLEWYSGISEVKANGPFDIILVDGPPAYAPGFELARLPALPLLIDAISSDGVVVLDDCNRPGEQRIIEIWRGMYPELNFSVYPEGKGVCVISRKSRLW